MNDIKKKKAAIYSLLLLPSVSATSHHASYESFCTLTENKSYLDGE